MTKSRSREKKMTDSEKLDLILTETLQLSSEVTEFKSEVKVEFEALKTEVNQLKNEVAQLKIRVDDNSKDIKGLKGEFRGLKGEVQGLKGEFRGLQVEVQDLRGEIQELKEYAKANRITLSHNSNEIVAIKKSIIDLKEDLDIVAENLHLEFYTKRETDSKFEKVYYYLPTDYENSEY